MEWWLQAEAGGELGHRAQIHSLVTVTSIRVKDNLCLINHLV